MDWVIPGITNLQLAERFIEAPSKKPQDILQPKRCGKFTNVEMAGIWVFQLLLRKTRVKAMVASFLLILGAGR